MSERPPLNAPITQQEKSHASRVMARWMQDTFRRLGTLARTKRPRIVIDGGDAATTFDTGWLADAGAADTRFSRVHAIDGGGADG